MKDIIRESRALASYNRANVFVWLKRHLRLASKYEAMHRADVWDFKQWNKELGTIIAELRTLKYSKYQQRLIDDAYFMHAMILMEISDEETLEHIEPCVGVTWIDLLINDDFRMSKHDTLQLLTLEHDHLYTLE